MPRHRAVRHLGRPLVNADQILNGPRRPTDLVQLTKAMAAFLFADLAYRDGGLLDSVSSAHALTALWSILMMNIGLMGIIYRAEKRFMLLEPDGLSMVVSYVLGLWLLFR